MPELYRVFPFHPAAAPDAPGGALYRPPQGSGRVDNPDLYSVLYLSSSASGAAAEAFGRFPEWSAAILEGSPSLPGSIRALGRYSVPDDLSICNLDDPQQLIALGLRPSDVVTRDYSRSKAWSRRIYEQGACAGVRWWSYYDADWSSVALWDTAALKLVDVTPLRLDHPAVTEAARVIARRITGPRR